MVAIIINLFRKKAQKFQFSDRIRTFIQKDVKKLSSLDGNDKMRINSKNVHEKKYVLN